MWILTTENQTPECFSWSAHRRDKGLVYSFTCEIYCLKSNPKTPAKTFGEESQTIQKPAASAITQPLCFKRLHPTAPLPHHHPVPFNTSGKEQAVKGFRSWWHQPPEVLHRPTVWYHGTHVQYEPEAGESSTAVEDLQCGTSTIDYTSKGPHQLQAGSTDRASHKDPWEAGPKISHPV